MSELKHLGLIIDGNRRYSKKYNTSLKDAYWMGAIKVKQAIEWSFGHFDIPELSIYALSKDNLNRTIVYLSPILKVQTKEYETWRTDPFFQEKGIMVCFYGDFGNLPQEYVDACKNLMERTEEHEEKKLNILVGYNGQREIAAAVRKWLELHKEKKVGTLLDELDATNPVDRGVGHLREHIGRNLDIPSPVDLIVRTGCEQRNSGFLTWQSEYAEFYGMTKLWPELTKEDLGTAIENFNNRTRRKGE